MTYSDLSGMYNQSQYFLIKPRPQTFLLDTDLLQGINPFKLPRLRSLLELDSLLILTGFKVTNKVMSHERYRRPWFGERNIGGGPNLTICQTSWPQ